MHISTLPVCHIATLRTSSSIKLALNLPRSFVLQYQLIRSSESSCISYPSSKQTQQLEWVELASHTKTTDRETTKYSLEAKQIQYYLEMTYMTTEISELRGMVIVRGGREDRGVERGYVGGGG